MVKQTEEVKKEKDRYTFEEYLLMEEQAAYRSEFWDGKIIPLEGATEKHAKITSNSHYALQQTLRSKKKECGVYDGSLKVYLEEYEEGLYPDVMVICGKPLFFKDRKDIVSNPLLVVEVLSPSTAVCDRGEKFAKYSSLPSFREYVIVSQDQPKVETWFQVEKDTWKIPQASGLESSVPLYSLGLEISLQDIYYLVDFTEES